MISFTRVFRPVARCHYRRWMSSTPSPYSVLGVRPSSTVDQIKAAFRKLAKEHHPDLNPQSNNQMSEIVAAYEAVMAPTSNVGGDSRVAIACEVMTLEELRRGHYVYTVQVLYEQNLEKETEETMVLDESIQTELSNSIIYKLVLHADDSVSDFKQSLQRHYGKEWGLDQRRSDRHGLAMGWELVTSGKDELQVLGNHWFLYTYQVAHGDLVHAIVRKNDKE